MIQENQYLLDTVYNIEVDMIQNNQYNRRENVEHSRRNNQYNRREKCRTFQKKYTTGVSAIL